MSKAPDSSNRIEAHRITKPIQLLAAWLVGLTAINISFLTAASVLQEPWWLRAVLVIASVLNVPMFLAAIFLLQTRFRPEMQEDTFYSKYLESRFTNKPEVDSEELSAIRKELYEASERTLVGVESLQNQVTTIATTLQTITVTPSSEKQTQLQRLDAQITEGRRLLDDARRDISWAKYRVTVNDLLPSFDSIVDKFSAIGIGISHTFGSTSQISLAPGFFVMTYGKEVAVEHVQTLVRLLSDLGLGGLHYSEEGGHMNQIYVGSYGYQFASVARLSDALRNEILQPGISADELAELVKDASAPVFDIDAALADMSELEAQLLKLHVGIDTDRPTSLDEISALTKVPRARVRQHLITALKKLDEHIYF